MKNLRQIHLYLGCLFAPLIIYFSVSGAWQLFRFNDVPKDQASPVRSALHAISNPHTHSTLPGRDPKQSQSPGFNWFAVFTALGMVLTSLLGVVLALKFSRRPALVFLCLGSGVVIPFLLLLWI